MIFRPPMDPVVRALQKALQSRIEALREVSTARVEPREIYRRGEITFLQVEICRDHLSLDVWLPEVLREEARSSGIARAHPFLGLEAVVIRFERAQDLARVARWVEASHDWAPVRDQAPRPSQVPQALIPSLEERLIKANSSRPSSPPPATEGPFDQRPTEVPGPPVPAPEPKLAEPPPRALAKKAAAPKAAKAKAAKPSSKKSGIATNPKAAKAKAAKPSSKKSGVAAKPKATKAKAAASPKTKSAAPKKAAAQKASGRAARRP